MRRAGFWMGLVMLIGPAFAAAQSPGPTAQQLSNAVRLGKVGTTGPLCGLRDAHWAADLWKAELGAMGADTGAGAADSGKRALTDRAGAALSYAEDEALESFAEAPPEKTCGPLANSPDLAQADRMVAAFRTAAGQPVW